jgi:hypothetical protein
MTAKAAVVDTTSAEKVVLAVARGRGRVGKTTLLRWLVDRTRGRGHLVTAADGDRNNQTLSGLFAPGHPGKADPPGGTMRPPSADDDDMRDWLTNVLEQMAEHRISTVLDVGGGDPFVGKYGQELDLDSFCSSVGVTPLSLIVLGPDEADLEHVTAIETGRSFLVPQTVIVLNEALVSQGRSAANAFGPMMELKAFRSIVGSGAKPVIMPRLGCMPAVSPWSRFTEAAAGLPDRAGTPLGPVRRQMVTTWLRNMELAFAPVAEWLP